MMTFLDLPPESWTAILLSVRIALVATLVALPFAIAFAWLLARIAFPGKMILDALIHLPLVIPPVVTGYLLLLSFGRQGWIGAALNEIGISFAFRWTGAALACGIMAFPLIVRPIRLSFETMDRRYEAAAATLGANPFRVFLTISLRWLCRASFLARCSVLLARSANSAQPSPLFPTFPARRKPSRPPSMC